MNLYYKIARPDGWDFHTGNTINYRQAVGTLIKHPHPNPSLGICSSGVLHASVDANMCFIGGKIPCSLYEVEGTPIIAHYKDKAGFVELFVRRELDPATHFKWLYQEAVHPIHPFHLSPPPSITQEHIQLLHQARSVWESVGASVGASVWASVGASVWASVGASVWESVWESVGASVGAYTGHIFVPVVTSWKYVNHFPGIYPYQPFVDLWTQGLVPSFDGRVSRLHSSPAATILWASKNKS